VGGDFEHGADAFVQIVVAGFQPAGDADEVERLTQRPPPCDHGCGDDRAEPQEWQQPAHGGGQRSERQVEPGQGEQAGERGDAGDERAAAGEHAPNPLPQAAQHRLKARSKGSV